MVSTLPVQSTCIVYGRTYTAYACAVAPVPLRDSVCSVCFVVPSSFPCTTGDGLERLARLCVYIALTLATLELVNDPTEGMTPSQLNMGVKFTIIITNVKPACRLGGLEAIGAHKDG